MAVESHPRPSIPPPHPSTPIRLSSTNSPMDPRHTPEAATARARRSLAASRAARSGITSVVESLRVTKPPRAPYKPGTQPSAATVARRHALIPLAEGRDKLEARIRSLEDSLAARDEASVRLKRQLGRALIKRRNLERERDSFLTRLATSSSVAQNCHALAVTTRTDFQAFVDCIVAIIQSTILSDPDSNAETNEALQIAAKFLSELQVSKEDTSRCLHLIIEAVQGTTEKLQTPLPPCTIDPSTPLPVVTSSVRSRPSNTAAHYPVSTAPSDEDARSCGSFTSSALGEDREAQLDSLVELVDILDAKLSSGATHAAASNALARARRTVSNARSKQSEERRETGECDSAANSHLSADEYSANGARRDADATAGESAHLGRSTSSPDRAALSLNEALALEASTKVELEEARRELGVMRQRILSLEKSAERGLRYDEVVEQNTLLGNQLATAKKTIARIIQDSRGSRKFSYSANGGPQSAGSTPDVTKKAGHGNPDAVQRILKWRQTASSEANTSITNGGPSGARKLELEEKDEVEKTDSRDDQEEADFDEAEQAPVNFARSKVIEVPPRRQVSNVVQRKPSQKDQNMAPGPSQISQDGNCSDEIEVEREISANAGARNVVEDSGSKTESANESVLESFDLGSNEVASSASGPVRGFLRLGTGSSAMSLSGDEVTFIGTHNIFGGRARQTDGLLGLLD